MYIQLLTMYSRITILLLLYFVVLYFQIYLRCYFLSVFKYDFVAYKAHKIKRSYPLIRFKRIINTYYLYHNETSKYIWIKNTWLQVMTILKQFPLIQYTIKKRSRLNIAFTMYHSPLYLRCQRCSMNKSVYLQGTRIRPISQGFKCFTHVIF